MTDQTDGKAVRKRRRKWPWALALVAVLGIVIAVVTNTTGDDTDTDTDTANVPEQESPTGPEVETAGIGQPVRDGTFEFTVTGVEHRDSVGDPYLTQQAQGQYVVVTVRVSNIGDQQGFFTDSDQYLLDANDRQYSADSAAGTSISGNDVLYNPINPGNNVEGQLVFDVPPDTATDRIELHDSFMSEGAVVDLR